MPRLAPSETLTLTPEQQRIVDEIKAGRAAGCAPLRPGCARRGWPTRRRRWAPTAASAPRCRPMSVSSPSSSPGANGGPSSSSGAHTRLGRQAGLPDDIIEAVRTGATPTFARDDTWIVHDVVTEYFATKRLSDATYARAIELIGERGLVDVVGIVGYYGLVSMTLNIFEVSVPEGETPPFAE